MSWGLFSELFPLCVGNPLLVGNPPPPHNGPVMRSYGVFFVVCVNKLLNEFAGYLRRHDAHDVTVMSDHGINICIEFIIISLSRMTQSMKWHNMYYRIVLWRGAYV